MSDAECIHGLDPALCDICAPRETPVRKPAGAAGPSRRVDPSRRPSATQGPSRPGSRGAVRVEQRVFRVATREELADWLADGVIAAPDDETIAFHTELAEVERSADEVVLVSTIAALGRPVAVDGDALLVDEVPFEAIVLIAVANEPARHAVRELLSLARRDVRVVLNPPWFRPSA